MSSPAVRIGVEFYDVSGSGNVINTSLSTFVTQIDTRLNSSLGRVNTSVGSVLGTFQKVVTSAASLAYLIESIGGRVKSALIDPFVALNKTILEITDNSRKWEYSVAQTAGGLSQARLLNLQLQRDSANLPTNVAQLRDAGKTLAANPAFSASLGFGSTADSAASIEQFAELAQKIQLLSPSGVNGENALRNALVGNLRGLRALGVSPQSLASGIGVTQKDLTGNPTLTLDAVSKWADTFLDQSSYSQITSLVSNRYEKLKDAIALALTKVGDAGFYDSISHKLKQAADSMFAYFGSQSFDAQAEKMSQSLERIAGSVAGAGKSLLDALTGKSNDLSTIAGTTQTITNLLDGFANAVDALKPAVEAFAGTLGLFMKATITLADIASHPNGAAAQQHPVVGGAVSGAEQVALFPGIASLRAYQAVAGSSWGNDARLMSMAFNAWAGSGGPPPSTQPSSGLSPRGDEPYLNTLVRQLTGQEYYAPPFDSLLGASSASVQQLRTLAAQSQSPIERLQGLSNVFSPVTIDHEPVQFQDLLKRIDSQEGSAMGILNTALSNAHQPDQINDINSAKADLLTRYQNALKQITDSKIADVQDLGEEIWKSIGDLPPGARANLQQSIIDGTTDVAKQFQAIFGAAPSAGFSIASYPIDVQRRFNEQNIQANVERIKALGVNQTPDQQSRSLLDYYSNQALPAEQGRLSRAQQNYGDNPTQLNKAEVDAAQESVVSLTAKIRDLRFETNDAAKTFAQFGASARQSLEGGLGDALFNLQTGMGSLSDVAKQTFQSILHEADQAAAHMLFQGLFGSAGVAGQGQNGVQPGPLGGILGSIIGGFAGPLWGGAAADIISGLPVSGQPINALGGVGSVPFGPGLNGFATGGISYSDQYARVSELGAAEAHIPLPDGRSVPVSLNGSGGKTINITQHFTTPNPEAFRKSAAQIKRQTRDAIGVE